jgi:large subunit ribosomal protein L6
LEDFDMSRIGKMPISIPSGVTFNFDEKSHVVTVKGPKGTLSQEISSCIKLANNDGELSLDIDENSP